MFSFGTIKTATALGGGVLIIRNNSSLAAAIDSLHDAYPVQKTSSYFKKLAKYMLLMLFFPPGIYRCLVAVLQRAAIDYDAFIHKLSRSFPGSDLMPQIRVQPGSPLLKLLLRRFETFPRHAIEEHIGRGRSLLQRLPETYRFPGAKSKQHTFWVFPILCDEPDSLIRKLRDSGYDATQKHSLQLVAPAEGDPGAATPNCRSILRHIVYLPLYPRIPTIEIERMIVVMQTESASGRKP